MKMVIRPVGQGHSDNADCSVHRIHFDGGFVPGLFPKVGQLRKNSFISTAHGCNGHTMSSGQVNLFNRGLFEKKSKKWLDNREFFR